MNTIVIQRDEDAGPPDWDSLAKIVTWHRDCKLKVSRDEPEFNTPEEFVEYMKEEGGMAYPVFMYDHSGRTISMTPFSCQFDSGQLGYVYITKAMLKEWGHDWKRLSPKRKNTIKSWCESTVKVWDSYLTGEVYGYEVISDCDSEVDSCWGFYGLDDIKPQIEELEKEFGECEVIYKE